MTTTPDPTDTARAIMREVLEMLADGGHTSGTTGAQMTLEDIVTGGFSTLHDYTDANTLGGMCDGLYEALRGDGDDPSAAWVDHCNQATDIVDVWLRAGALDPDEPHMLLATCGQCREVFAPSDLADLLHVETVAGTPCGGLARTLDIYSTTNRKA